MIENMNGFISVVVIAGIFLGSIFGFYKLNKRFKKDEENDEYYQDLL